MDGKIKQKMWAQVAVLVVGILVFLVIWRFSVVVAMTNKVLHILQPIQIGLVIAYLFYPLVKKVRKIFETVVGAVIPSKKFTESFSNMLSIVIVFLAVGFSIYWLGRLVLPELVDNIVSAVNQVPNQLRILVAYATQAVQENQQIYDQLNGYIGQLQTVLQEWLKNDFLGQINTVVTSVSSGIFGVISLLGNFVIGIIVAVYVLSSTKVFKRQLKKLIYAFAPENRVDVVVQVLRQSNMIFSGFITGKVIDGIIIGILCFIFMYFAKMPYYALISVMVGVSNIIPFFGPFIGGIFGAILLLIVAPKSGLIFILFILVLQQVDGNIIGPAILGDSTGLSPFWVIFSILLGGGIFGVAGMILGVPTFGVLYYVAELYIHHRLKQKGLSPEQFGPARVTRQSRKEARRRKKKVKKVEE